MNVLFVCTGNINRSPAGQIILSTLAERQGIEIGVDSAGTSDTNQGNLMTKKMRMALQAIGYPDLGLRSKPVTQDLIDWADEVFCMSPTNARNLRHLNTGKKVKLLGRILVPPQDTIDDPHFHGGHLEVAKQIEVGCKRWLLAITR